MAKFDKLPIALQEIGEEMAKKDYKILKYKLAEEYSVLDIKALYEAIPTEYEASIQHFASDIKKNPNDVAAYYCLKQLYANKHDEISQNQAQEYDEMRKKVMVAQFEAFEDIFNRVEDIYYNNSPKDIQELKEAVKSYVQNGYNIQERDSTGMTLLDKINTIDTTKTTVTNQDIQDLKNMLSEEVLADKALGDKSVEASKNKSKSFMSWLKQLFSNDASVQVEAGPQPHGIKPLSTAADNKLNNNITSIQSHKTGQETADIVKHKKVGVDVRGDDTDLHKKPDFQTQAQYAKKLGLDKAAKGKLILKVDRLKAERSHSQHSEFGKGA